MKLVRFRKILIFSIISILLLSLTLFPCYAAVLTNVEFVSNGLPYDSSINISYGANSESSVDLGGNLDLVFEPITSSDNLVYVTDGVLDLFGDVFDVEGYVSDGTYVVFGSYSGINSTTGNSLVVPLVDGSFYTKTSSDMIVSINSYEDIPSNIIIELAEVDIENSLMTMGIFLIPYTEPTVTDSITYVWTDILIWITDSINAAVGIFWNGTQLTLIGTLSLVGVSLFLCLLIYNKVKDYLKMQ